MSTRSLSAASALSLRPFGFPMEFWLVIRPLLYAVELKLDYYPCQDGILFETDVYRPFLKQNLSYNFILALVLRFQLKLDS